VHFLVTVAVLVSAPPSGGAAARRAEATAALEAAERARGATVVSNAQELYERGWIAEKRLAFFGEAARLVEEGKRKLSRVELEAAAEAFEAAETVYSAHKAWDGVASAYAEAAKWRGVALFELKRRDDAMRAFSRAKGFDPATELTEAMVRPDVARAFAAAPAGTPMYKHGDRIGDGPRSTMEQQLGLDDVIAVALAVDAGVLTYAGVLKSDGCQTDVVVAMTTEEVVRRMHEATCKPGQVSYPETAPAIAHPRPAPSLTKAGPTVPRRTRVWEKPLLWVGVVGALGVGVVLAVNLWPRDASYSLSTDFHQFSLRLR
jgi:hypothetical protein